MSGLTRHSTRTPSRRAFGSITISNARALADLAVKHRLATGANFIECAEAGGLMGWAKKSS
jgi:hypothetical protein